MKHPTNRLWPWFFVVAALAIALPAAGQGNGLIQGFIKDAQGQPIENAKVTIESTEGVPRKLESKTGKKGDYAQVGLVSGAYKVTVEKDKMSATRTVRVAAFDTSTADFVLAPPAPTSPPETAGKGGQSAEMQKTFREGVAAAQANRFDDALTKFLRSAELAPNCAECYYNIGAIYDQQAKYEQAAAAVMKGDELLAVAGANAPAPNADALYHHGVILWNAGKFPEAKKQFEAAVQADASHAESHFRLGLSLLQEGNLTPAGQEFDTYLKLAPTGPNAAQAKDFVASTRAK